MTYHKEHLDALARGISEWIKNPEEFEQKARKEMDARWSNVSVNKSGYLKVNEYGSSIWVRNKE